MKKWFAFLLILLTLVSPLTACGTKTSDSSGGTQSESESGEDASEASQTGNLPGYDENGVFDIGLENCTVTDEIEGITTQVTRAVFFTNGSKYFVLIQPQYKSTLSETYSAFLERIAITDNRTGRSISWIPEINLELNGKTAALDPSFKMVNEPSIVQGETASGNWIGGYISKLCKDATITIQITDTANKKIIGKISVHVKAP